MGQTIIELETASDIHWWKGICKGKWEILATSGDNHGPKTATMTMKELDGDVAFYTRGGTSWQSRGASRRARSTRSSGRKAIEGARKVSPTSTRSSYVGDKPDPVPPSSTEGSPSFGLG